MFHTVLYCNAWKSVHMGVSVSMACLYLASSEYYSTHTHTHRFDKGRHVLALLRLLFLVHHCAPGASGSQVQTEHTVTAVEEQSVICIPIYIDTQSSHISCSVYKCQLWTEKESGVSRTLCLSCLVSILWMPPLDYTWLWPWIWGKSCMFIFFIFFSHIYITRKAS